MNAFYVNINVGSQGSPQGIPSVTSSMVRPDRSQYSSPSQSSSSLSSSSDYSPLSSMRPNLASYGSTNSQVIPKGLANNAMFDPIRYKTEMCKNFIELGHCKFEEKCYYAHFAHELKVATYKPKNYKTQLCKPFHTEGFCDFGARCAFIHSKPNVDQIVNSLQTFLSSAPPMPDIRAEEEMIAICFNNPFTEKRLKVFENMSSK